MGKCKHCGDEKCEGLQWNTLCCKCWKKIWDPDYVIDCKSCSSGMELINPAQIHKKRFRILWVQICKLIGHKKATTWYPWSKTKKDVIFCRRCNSYQNLRR